jgi:hypothetical protein
MILAKRNCIVPLLVAFCGPLALSQIQDKRPAMAGGADNNGGTPALIRDSVVTMSDGAKMHLRLPITNVLLAGPDYSSRRTLRPADFIVFYVGCRIDQALKVIRVIPGLFNVRACVCHDSFTRVPERKQKKLYLCLFCPTQ